MAYIIISNQKQNQRQSWLKVRPVGLGLLLAVFASMAMAGVTAKDLKVCKKLRRRGCGLSAMHLLKAAMEKSTSSRV